LWIPAWVFGFAEEFYREERNPVRADDLEATRAGANKAR